MKKRIICFILSVVTAISVITGSMSVFAADEQFFNDVNDSDWFYDSVKTVYTRGIMLGKESNNFDPRSPVTRGEMAVIFSRLAEAQTSGMSSEASAAFSDINGDEFYADSIGWGVSTGLIGGYGDGTVRGKNPILRTELATMLSRFLGYMKLEVKCENPIERFTDADEIPDWAVKDVDAVRLTGIFAGDDNGNFNPYSNATRAEIATVVTRIIGYMDNAADDGFDELLPDDGESFEYSGALKTDAFEAYITYKVGNGVYVKSCDFTALSSAFASAEPGTEVNADVTVSFGMDGSSVQSSRTLKISMEKPENPTDPTPDVLGTVYESDGISISNAVDVGEYLTFESLGSHGGHETRIARTRYGTYMVFFDSMRYDEKHPEGSNYSDFFFWMVGSIYKIESTGVKKIYTFEYPRTMCAAPNIIAGNDGMLYLPVTADDKEKYIDAGLNDEGAWLAIYEIDSKTDKVTESVYRTDYEFGWPEYYTGGYGYSQPVFDNARGIMYFLSNGGTDRSYLAIFSYNVNTHEWSRECRTLQSSHRLGYMNCYIDAKGGLVIVAQRVSHIKDLNEKYDDVFISGSGYAWDALYLFHIPDPTDMSTVVITPIIEPDYPNNANKNGIAHPQQINHYSGGTTYMDSEGRLHVLYEHIIGSKIKKYHVVYDRDLNEIHRSEFAPTLEGGRYAMALTQGAGGKYYLILEPMSVKDDIMQIEIWESDDGINFTRVVESFSMNNPETGLPFKKSEKLIIGSVRSGSDTDGVIPVIFPDYGGTEHYFYFSIKVSG